MSGYIGTQPLPQATQTRDVFTATSGQTSFATSGYTPNFLDCWLNGVKLVNGDDFTATNGSDVVLTSGAATGDTVEVLSYSTFEVNSQTFTGTTTLTGDLQATTATFSGAVTGTSATLSGGVYLGGTGAANLLDDYEEGEWSPNLILSGYGTIGVNSGYGGRYTRIGKTVFFNLYGRWNTLSRTGVQETRVSLPFACKAANGGNQTYAGITVSYLSAFVQNQSTYIVGGYVEDGQPHLRLHIFQGNSELPITDTYLSASSSAGIMISGQYDIE